MAEVLVSELADTRRAFELNRLLSTFAPDVRALLEPFGRVAELESGEVLWRRGDRVTSSIFPFGPTMVSMSVDLNGGRSIEVASIGREGAIGGIVSCGHAPAFSQAAVLVSGPAFCVPVQALERAKERSPFIANIFCRFSDYLLAQVMQSVACNAFHGIADRAARWLLHVQDRAGDRIELTQEALAGLLGVQRTTVNAVVRSLQDEGLITTRRGVVHLTNREGLKKRACECYGALEHHFSAVIGTTGSGDAG